MVSNFEQLSIRLNYLEKWREIAIRPTLEQCLENDKDLLVNDLDNIEELSKRCLSVRRQMNAVLPCHKLALDDFLIVKESSIPFAGKGLFYIPSDSLDIVKNGSIICHYTGHRHNSFSQKYLKDKSYLLNVFQDLFVDPGPDLSIKARYINDPLNEGAVNCKFVPDPINHQCLVVATRDIRAQEELFVSYGEFYWSQQSIKGTIFSSKGT